MGKNEKNLKKSFRFGKNKFGSNTDTEIGPWFQLPIPKPGFSPTLPYDPNWLINYLISDHFCDIHRICCLFDQSVWQWMQFLPQSGPSKLSYATWINYLFPDHFCDIHRICCRFDHRYDNEYNFFHSASQHQQWANWQSKASSHRSYLHLLVYNWVSPTFSRYIQWTSLTVPTVCTFQASAFKVFSISFTETDW